MSYLLKPPAVLNAEFTAPLLGAIRGLFADRGIEATRQSLSMRATRPLGQATAHVRLGGQLDGGLAVTASTSDAVRIGGAFGTGDADEALCRLAHAAGTRLRAAVTHLRMEIAPPIPDATSQDVSDLFPGRDEALSIDISTPLGTFAVVICVRRSVPFPVRRP